MSTISVDTSILTYCLKYVFSCDDSDQVNYVCLRIAESVPQMQRNLCVWCIQDIEDYLSNNDPHYLKLKPIERLLECIRAQRKEFV